MLFSGTIRENILYGLNPGAQVDEAVFDEVVRKAHVDEFSRHLPDGLNTLVGQRGMMLSGGQKQRVAIARALIKVCSTKYGDLDFSVRKVWRNIEINEIQTVITYFALLNFLSRELLY